MWGVRRNHSLFILIATRGHFNKGCNDMCVTKKFWSLDIKTWWCMNTIKMFCSLHIEIMMFLDTIFIYDHYFLWCFIIFQTCCTLSIYIFSQQPFIKYFHIITIGHHNYACNIFFTHVQIVFNIFDKFVGLIFFNNIFLVLKKVW
jgi:hypothetical protein